MNEENQPEGSGSQNQENAGTPAAKKDNSSAVKEDSASAGKEDSASAAKEDSASAAKEDSSCAAKEGNKEEGDKLKVEEKVLAGFLLIFFSVLAMILIVAYWPDRLPQPKEGLKPLYVKELWHVRLACIKDSFCCADSVLLEEGKPDTTVKKPETPATVSDSARRADSIKALTDSTQKPGATG